jgi:hypothetical protein
LTSKSVRHKAYTAPLPKHVQFVAAAAAGAAAADDDSEKILPASVSDTVVSRGGVADGRKGRAVML